MPSPTDFNLSPYYDDFSESKKFHRILFRPSFAVQAREVTQSQSILQLQLQLRLPFQLEQPQPQPQPQLQPQPQPQPQPLEV